MDEQEEGFGIRFAGMKNAFSSWLVNNIYPIVIFIASVLVLVIVPMIGSTGEAGSSIPTDPEQAFLYWVLKGMTAALNMTIFAAFRRQAKVKSKNSKGFLEAEAILGKTKTKKQRYVSPAKFAMKQWGTKGITLLISTGVTSVALTNIVIYYDWVTAIGCAVTILIAIIFGLMTLASEEYYWQVEYLRYAKSVEGEKNGNNHRQQDLSQHPGTGSGECEGHPEHQRAE